MSEATCSVPECGRSVKRRGWCIAHHARWLKWGDVQADRPIRAPRVPIPPGTVCSAPECDITQIEGYGLCRKHNERRRNHGSTENMRGKFQRTPKPRIPCSVDGCHRVGMPKNDGRCAGHHLRWKTYGEVGSATFRESQKYQPGQTCSVDDCENVARVRGWCTKHWDRWKKYGDPLHLTRRERTPVRTCAFCLRTPDQVPFHRSSASPDGLTARCKLCLKAYQQLYLGTKASNDPLVLKKNARTRRWRDRNRDRVQENGRRWRANNRDIRHAHAERRRRLLQGLDGRIPTLNRRRIWKSLRGLCGLCALPVSFEKMHVDHIKPVTKGGSHSYTNVQPSHPACNLRKSNREVAPWAFATASDRRRAERMLRKQSSSESRFVSAMTPSIFSMSLSMT